MMKLLVWSGVAGPAIRLSLIVLLGYLTPGYSQLRDAISELGARGAPYAGLMNFVGISLVGLLLVLFSPALYRAYRGRLAAAGAIFLALSDCPSSWWASSPATFRDAGWRRTRPPPCGFTCWRGSLA